MKLKVYPIIFGLILLMGCNSEEGITPTSQNAFIKIYEGLGQDLPLAVKASEDGNLLVFTNSTSFTANSSKIRILKLNKDGGVIQEKYYPEVGAGNWSAKEILITPSNRIILGGTLKDENLVADTSIFIFEINANLDSVNFTYYNDGSGDNYGFGGMHWDENTSELLLMASKGNQATLYGEFSATDLSLQGIETSTKPQAPPATKLYRDANQKLIWALDANRIVILKSDRSMRTTDELDDYSIANTTDFKSKKLIANENEISIFGDLERNGDRRLFYYPAYSRNPIVFGGDGNTFLNGVSEFDQGKFLITGYDDVLTEGQNRQSDFYLARRNAGGGESFSRSFGSNVDEALYDATMINNKIYCIGTTIFSGNNTLIMIKTNQFGELEN